MGLYLNHILHIVVLAVTLLLRPR